MKSVIKLWKTAFPLFAGMFIICAGCAQQPISPEESAEIFSEYLNERVPRLMGRYGIPGAVIAVIREGETVWTGAFGYADVEEKQKMTVNAVCRGESISKSVTAWGVMKLSEQGLIDLDAPVQKYLEIWKLPESAYSEQEVTIRRLLSGNAGMPLGPIGESIEYDPGSSMPSLKDYLNQEAELMKEPGSGFLYSNTGFNLLELLIEEVTGRDFAAYMEEEVLVPLGMKNSAYSWKESFNGSVPAGYELRGTPVPPYVYPVNASGGLFSDVEDLARFAGAGMTGISAKGNPVLSRESLQQLYTPQVEIFGMFGVVAEAYGFGHFIEILSDGRKAVWHGGQGHGWITHFHFIPESGEGIVILTNSQRSWPFLAKILPDWAHWCGFENVKFGRITYASNALMVLIGIIFLIVVWRVYCLVLGLSKGERRFCPFSPESWKVRIIQAVLGIGIIIALVWAVLQPYLFISSLFPGLSVWAGFIFLSFAIVMVISSLNPRIENEE